MLFRACLDGVGVAWWVKTASSQIWKGLTTNVETFRGVDETGFCETRSSDVCHTQNLLASLNLRPPQNFDMAIMHWNYKDGEFM